MSIDNSKSQELNEFTTENNANDAILTRDVSRIYQSYIKPEGLWNSLKGFANRQYQNKIALSPTTLVIPRGQVIGLVGANGAGKTTLLKVLSGLVQPSSGSARVLGFDPTQRSSEFLKKISILLGQKNQLWWDLTPKDSYSLLMEIYDLEREPARQRIKELAEILDCTHVLETQLRRLSLGERMKMEIIGALLHEPEVLFLDEPTIGLDIVAQSSIRKFLEDYVKRKRPTVILTSHYMDDIAKLADRLLLISKGHIVYDGTVNGFTRKTEHKRQIHFQLSEALVNKMVIKDSYAVEALKLDHKIEVDEKDLPFVLAAIAQISGVKDIQIQERDFEDVIREFLEKESGLLQARGTQ